MRIDYDPSERLARWFGALKDGGNIGAVNAYMLLDDVGRLKALQYMRDSGLLHETHMALARKRREYWALMAERERLFTLAKGDYERYWYAYQHAKTRSIELRREAHRIYEEMFSSDEWQRRYRGKPAEPRQLALMEATDGRATRRTRVDARRGDAGERRAEPTVRLAHAAQHRAHA